MAGDDADSAIGDKGCESDSFVDVLDARGNTAVIPSLSNRNIPRPFDSACIQGTPPHRMLLWQNQALPPGVLPVREDGAKFHGIPAVGHHAHVDPRNVNRRKKAVNMERKAKIAVGGVSGPPGSAFAIWKLLKFPHRG